MELGRSSIVEYETDDGEWLEARFYPTTVGLSVYFRNIDQRKHKELERDELFEALRANQAMLERSQELAHLGSWELDLQSGRLTWSDEVYRIFGLQPQEFGATYEAFLERMHPDDRQAVDAAYSGSLREERDTYEIEHRVVRKTQARSASCTNVATTCATPPARSCARWGWFTTSLRPSWRGGAARERGVPGDSASHGGEILASTEWNVNSATCLLGEAYKPTQLSAGPDAPATFEKRSRAARAP